MELRTTPEHYDSRDHELFPALDLVCQRYGVPLFYSIEVFPDCVLIDVGDFFIEEQMRARLVRLYNQYEQWCPEPKKWELAFFPVDFCGYVSLAVIPEHAQWWIDLLNETAPFLEEQARRCPTPDDEDAQWIWKPEPEEQTPARVSH